MSLHDRIMEINKDSGNGMAFKVGYRTARREAATLATEADELMAEMARAIKAVHIWAEEENRNEAARLIGEVLAKYNTYMERNNEQ